MGKDYLHVCACLHCVHACIVNCYFYIWGSWIFSMHTIINQVFWSICGPVVDWAVRRRSKQRIEPATRGMDERRCPIDGCEYLIPEGAMENHGKPSAGSHTSSHEPQRAGVKSRSREKTDNITSSLCPDGVTTCKPPRCRGPRRPLECWPEERPFDDMC